MITAEREIERYRKEKAIQREQKQRTTARKGRMTLVLPSRSSELVGLHSRQMCLVTLNKIQRHD